MRWTDCTDIVVTDDDGSEVYDGPKFKRCYYNECGSLVTQGQIEQHGTCVCGGRKMRAAVLLTINEISGLMTGKYLLNEWENELIGNDEIELPIIEEGEND